MTSPKRDELVLKIFKCIESAHHRAASTAAASMFGDFLLEDLKKAGCVVERKLDLEGVTTIKADDTVGADTVTSAAGSVASTISPEASVSPKTVLLVANEILVIARNSAELKEEHLCDAHTILRMAGVGKAVVVSAGKKLAAQKIITPPFSADTIIAEIQDSFPEKSRAAFKEIGVHCFDCAVGYEDDLREVARQHEMEVDALVSQLNSVFLALKSK